MRKIIIMVGESEGRYSDDNMGAKAIRDVLISNGLLTREGKFDTAKGKKLGWSIADNRAELNIKEH